MDKLVQPDWLEGNLSAPDVRILDCSVVFERIDGVLNIESARERWNQEHIPEERSRRSDDGAIRRDLRTPVHDAVQPSRSSP